MPLNYITRDQAIEYEIPKNSIQTILINRDISLNTSKNWLKKNGYNYQYYRLEGNYRRFQQNPPVIYATYYSKKITPDITLVFQKY